MSSKKNFCPHIYPSNRDINKTWFVSFLIPTFKGLLNKRVKIQVPNLPTVEKRLAAAQKIVSDVQKNGYVTGAKQKPKKIGFSDQIQMLYDLLEKKRGVVADKTIVHYKGQIDNLNKFCTEKKITVLKASDAEDFLKSLRLRGLNPTTINSHRMTLKSLFATLKKQKRVYQNPFLDTLALKQNPCGAKWFQINQQAILKKRILSDAPHIWLPVQYLYYCFIRPIEMRRLTVSDVNMCEGTINIPADKSKNKKNQFVVIPAPLLLQMFDANIQDAPPQYFLIGKDGLPSLKQVGTNYLSNQHKKLTDALKFPPKYTLYSWKHTGVAMAYKNGVGIRELQLQLRHHSLDMVTVYLRSLGIADLPDLKDKFPEL